MRKQRGMVETITGWGILCIDTEQTIEEENQCVINDNHIRLTEEEFEYLSKNEISLESLKSFRIKERDKKINDLLN